MGLVSVRRDDWLPRLEALLAEAQTKHFAWGQHDCCTFAMDAIEAITGENPLPELKGAYDSRFAGLRWLSRKGFSSIEDALDAVVGNRLPGPRLAGRGDIVLVESMTVGVVDGTASRVACLNMDEPGLVYLPPQYAVAAWSR